MSFSITSSEPVRLQRYVVAAIAIAVAWLAATMAANIVIDPQGVFGSDLFRIHLNPNARYGAFRDYEAEPERYDAVLFASSRGNAFDRASLAAHLGVRTVANFSVPFGLLTDHLPALEFLLRDKAARGGHIKAVFLVLDADFFGKQPWTNLNIDSFLPPQISGESSFRFWWRYLTAFQFKHWRSDFIAARNASLARIRSAAAPAANGLRARLAAAGLVPVRPLGPIAMGRTPVAETFSEETDAPEIRSDLAHQLDLLARFVALCRQHEIRLTVAFSPLNRQNVGDDQAPDDARVVGEVARLTPVWDFARPVWLSERGYLWNDYTQYAPGVAAMMMQRFFGAPPAAPVDFGRLKGS